MPGTTTRLEHDLLGDKTVPGPARLHLRGADDVHEPRCGLRVHCVEGITANADICRQGRPAQGRREGR